MRSRNISCIDRMIVSKKYRIKTKNVDNKSIKTENMAVIVVWKHRMKVNKEAKKEQIIKQINKLYVQRKFYAVIKFFWNYVPCLENHW